MHMKGILYEYDPQFLGGLAIYVGLDMEQNHGYSCSILSDLQGRYLASFLLQSNSINCGINLFRAERGLPS